MKQKLILILSISIAFAFLSTHKVRAESVYPNLVLIKNIEPKEIYTPGEQINYEITINNESSEYAENITIEDVLDPRLEFISQNSLDYQFTQQQQKLQWQITSIDPWSNYTIDFSTKLGFNIGNGAVIGNKIRAVQVGIEDIFSNNIEFTVTANTFKLDGFPIGSEVGLNLELNDNSYTLTNNEKLFSFTDTTCKTVDGMQITGKLITKPGNTDSKSTRVLVEAGNNIFELVLIDLSIVFATLILIVRKYKRDEKIHI